MPINAEQIECPRCCWPRSLAYKELIRIRVQPIQLPGPSAAAGTCNHNDSAMNRDDLHGQGWNLARGSSTTCELLARPDWAASSRSMSCLPGLVTARPSTPQMKQPPVVQGVVGGCTEVRNPLAGVDGNRPEDDNRLSGHDLQVEPESGNAISGAVEVIPHPDSNLTHVIEAWAALSPDTRAAILAIVESAPSR